ncbi:hypothetical protein N8645_00675 [bacterium]|nr:hypothetical protein [bacterium]
MHISLDSALGRQRKLNSVGESVLQIAPNAAAAYSLRSLTGGDPKVVRVRRDTDGGAGDNDEQDFTASGISSGALVDFVGSGNDGFVETWYDQSGNSEDAVQETSGNQPKIVSAGALVADGIDFDGSNDRLNIPNDLIANINSASAFLVAKSDTISGSRIALALSHSTSNFRFYAGALLGNKLNFGYQNTAVKIELSSADTNKHLFTSIAGSSNAEAFLDGTSKGTVSSVDGKSTLSSGGIGSINSGNFWSGTIEEVIVYNTDQSANRVALETNIQAKYTTLP